MAESAALLIMIHASFVRRWCVLFGLIAGLIGLQSADAFAQCRVHVDAGGLSKRMIELLAREVPDCEIVTSSRAATLSLAITRVDGHLDVAVVAPPSTPVLARRVQVDEGDPEPALRRIALLTARAVESSARLPPREPTRIEATPELEPFHLAAEVSFATRWWSSPSSPRFGPALALSFELGAFEAGLWVAFFSPDARDVEGVDASATELSLLIRGAWRPLSLGPLSFELELGAGLNGVWITARPIAFIEGADETRVRTVEGLIRGGAAIEASLIRDRLHVFIRGGGLLRLRPVEIDVPSDYGDESIRTGRLVPWAELGLSVRFL